MNDDADSPQSQAELNKAFIAATKKTLDGLGLPADAIIKGFLGSTPETASEEDDEELDAPDDEHAWAPHPKPDPGPPLEEQIADAEKVTQLIQKLWVALKGQAFRYETLLKKGKFTMNCGIGELKKSKFSSKHVERIDVPFYVREEDVFGMKIRVIEGHLGGHKVKVFALDPDDNPIDY